MKYNKLLIISIVTIALVFAIAYILPSKKIPIVTIGYNNLFFMRNFINQLKQFDNPIIILDNKSTFEPMFEYYDEIKNELGSRIEIRLLNQNYGSNVTSKLKHTLPNLFILSDCVIWGKWCVIAGDWGILCVFVGILCVLCVCRL